MPETGKTENICSSLYPTEIDLTKELAELSGSIEKFRPTVVQNTNFSPTQEGKKTELEKFIDNLEVLKNNYINGASAIKL